MTDPRDVYIPKAGAPVRNIPVNGLPCIRSMQMLLRCACAWVLMTITLASVVSAQVSAVADTFHVGGTSILDVSANDRWSVGDDVEVEVTQGPQHGIVRVLPDGRVAYQPNTTPVQPDRFAYRFRTRPLQMVQLAPETSMLDFGAEVITPLGSASDLETIGVAGMAGVHVWAGGDSVRVASLAIRNVADVGLRFDYGSPIVFATLRVKAAADSIALFQSTPAPATARTGVFGTFAHTAVPFDIRAAVTLEGTGLFSGQVPEGIQRLETSADRVYSGSVVLSTSTILLTLNVAFVEAFPLADNTVGLSISGSLQGAGPVRPVETSGEAEVTILPATDTSVDAMLPPDARALVIYPNPARTHATIDGLSPDGEWVLVDVLGRVIRQGTGPGVKLDGIPAGVHYIRTPQGTLLLTIFE